MTNQQKIILGLVIVVVVVVGAIAFWSVQLPKQEVTGPPAKTEEPGPGPAEETTEGEGEEVPAGGFLPVEPVDWTNPEEPMSSPPMEEEELPKETIKIEITAAGFSPATFEVKKSKEIILSVTSKDQWTHVFKFKDEKLAEVAIGVAPGETRAITFYAPQEKGEYPFFCDVPGHEARGETGTMIVK